MNNVDRKSLLFVFLAEKVRPKLAIKTASHSTARCHADIVKMSLSTFNQRRRCVSNETPNDISIERLHGVLLKPRDDISRGGNKDFPSARLNDVSIKFQMKHSTISHWYLTNGSIRGTYPRHPISTYLLRLLYIPNETPHNVAVVHLLQVSELRCCNTFLIGLYYIF